MPTIFRNISAPTTPSCVTTVDALHAARSFPLPCDICVTLAHRRGEVEQLVAERHSGRGLSFIPAEETRARLAMVDPMARVGIVSIFPEFMALMKPGVLRFTPHVSDVDVRLITAPDLEAFLSRVDVGDLCQRRGSDPSKDFCRRDRQAIEFRYVPDPHAIRATPAPGYRAAALVHRFQEEMTS